MSEIEEPSMDDAMNAITTIFRFVKRTAGSDGTISFKGDDADGKPVSLLLASMDHDLVAHMCKAKDEFDAMQDEAQEPLIDAVNNDIGGTPGPLMKGEKP